MLVLKCFGINDTKSDIIHLYNNDMLHHTSKLRKVQSRITFEWYSVLYVTKISVSAIHNNDMFYHTDTKSCLTMICEPRHEISNNVVCVTSKAADQPAHMRRLIRAFASRLTIL